ncbi:heat shock protein HtpX [Catenulispora sp. GP43]|uniref:zinc metalloprotease HtpX n=1 Tax=Catenulispora sp. GP43 TaxID=3156263 RepID=UPI00351541BB
MESRIQPDRKLTARMGLTLFLLGLLYVAFAAVLVVLLKSVVLIVVILGGLLFAQYWYSDRITLAALKGQIVTEEEYPQLHAIVDRLCALADMPKPKVAVAELDVPNAFATGRNAEHAVVCVTTGMMALLDEKELEGVLAHELTHVAHRDVAVITIASFLGVMAGLIMRFTLYSQAFGRRQDQNTAIIMMAITVVSLTVYAVSFVLIRALSRYRELAADRDGAILTGQPSELASALVKLSDKSSRIPHRDLRSVQAFNAFFISPVGGSIANLFSTHPKLERRLEQLAQLSEQMGRPV